MLNVCDGKCSECKLKINRRLDAQSKLDLLDDNNIFYEKLCVEKFEFRWCIKQYCNFDGYLSKYLLDVKNKRKRDGSGENFTRYSHDLGLIITQHEVLYASTLKNAFNMNGAFFVYCFEDGMYAVESDMILRYGIPAPYGKEEVYYMPFGHWEKVHNQEELFDLIRKDYSIERCRICGQESYTNYHIKCYIKWLRSRIRAFCDEDLKWGL